MIHHIPFRVLPWAAALVAALLVPVAAKSKKSKSSKDEPRLRLVCATSLGHNQQIVLAKLDDEGQFRELASASLRSSSITEWLPAATGELHLALREEGGLKSICKFDYPADSSRVLAGVMADQEKKTYEVHAVDPVSMGFDKATVLIFNFSPHVCTVTLGEGEQKIEAGRDQIAKPVLEDNGMYHLLISYQDEGGKSVLNYDRHVPGSPDSRDMLFLMPDKKLGLKILSLPMFGTID